jgi:hypothetical protein
MDCCRGIGVQNGPLKTQERPEGYRITLELTEWGEIVQCRGFANRRPQPNEVSIVKRWADEYGLTWGALDL